MWKKKKKIKNLEPEKKEATSVRAMEERKYATDILQRTKKKPKR